MWLHFLQFFFMNGVFQLLWKNLSQGSLIFISGWKFSKHLQWFLSFPETNLILPKIKASNIKYWKLFHTFASLLKFALKGILNDISDFSPLYINSIGKPIFAIT